MNIILKGLSSKITKHTTMELLIKYCKDTKEVKLVTPQSNFNLTENPYQFPNITLEEQEPLKQAFTNPLVVKTDLAKNLIVEVLQDLNITKTELEDLDKVTLMVCNESNIMTIMDNLITDGTFYLADMSKNDNEQLYIMTVELNEEDNLQVNHIQEVNLVDNTIVTKDVIDEEIDSDSLDVSNPNWDFINDLSTYFYTKTDYIEYLIQLLFATQFTLESELSN